MFNVSPIDLKTLEKRTTSLAAEFNWLETFAFGADFFRFLDGTSLSVVSSLAALCQSKLASQVNNFPQVEQVPSKFGTGLVQRHFFAIPECRYYWLNLSSFSGRTFGRARRLTERVLAISGRLCTKAWAQAKVCYMTLYQRLRRSSAITKPIRTRRKPTGRVKNMNQMKVPVPLPSSHMEPPWKSEVTKAKRIGEMAKIKPMRIKGNRIISKV